MWAHDAQAHNTRLTWSSSVFGRLRAYKLRNPGPGPYDIARVQASSLDLLGRLVVSQRHAVGGVTSMLTCAVISQ